MAIDGLTFTCSTAENFKVHPTSFYSINCPKDQNEKKKKISIHFLAPDEICLDEDHDSIFIFGGQGRQVS